MSDSIYNQTANDVIYVSDSDGRCWITTAAQSPWTTSAPTLPVKARWHAVQDVWALVDDTDGEVLATVEEKRGIWLMEGDGGETERYISESAAKKRAEEYAGVDEIITPTRQNSAGIP